MIASSKSRGGSPSSASFNPGLAARSRPCHTRTTSRSARGALWLAGAATCLSSVACGSHLDTTEIDGVRNALMDGAEFVSVRKALTGGELAATVPASRPPAAGSPAAGSPDVVGTPEASGDFYIAIKKSSLSERWFLSAYMKQFYPDFGNGDFAYSLGTRVVSFNVQNDKLYVFDASEQFEFSALSDPTLLVEAYPIVHRPEFDRLPGASDYVLFDPASGLNEFAITGNLFGDPLLSGSLPLEVGASFMQNFRVLADGAAFEQVFTGDDASSLTAPPTSVWGTLGVALRHYAVGDGFVPFEDTTVPFYFRSPLRSVPDSNGELTSNAARWNIYPGMEPIEVLITAGAQRAQADYPGADVLGAFARGVEAWNDVFGFEALRAVQVDDDRVPDDDDNVVLVDYPGTGAGFAFADWRNNPDNGEIRGGSVYFSGVFLGMFDALGASAVPPEQALASLEPAAPQADARHLAWGGMPAQEERCFYPAPAPRPPAAPGVAAEDEPAPLTPEEQGARFIQHVVLHEVGHMLGLRHNFKGSLLPPSSSVMDYLDDLTDAIAAPTPQSYDRDAIRYLYGLSAEPPAQPFCTDDSVVVDPTCALFDSQAEPLTEWWAPRYAPLVELIADANLPPEFLDIIDLNSVLGFARDAGFVDPSLRLAALNIALGPAAVPIAPERLEDPTAISGANGVAEFVLRRAVLDPEELRGFIGFDIADPDVLAALTDQAGRMLANEDGVRSYALRRTAVDVLKRLQSEPALLALRTARDALIERLGVGGVPTPEVPLAEDLLARVEGALAPYFD